MYETEYPEVSILLVALGDYSQNIEAIKNIKTDYKYEICVCSDKEIRFPKEYNVRFLPDTGTSVSAYNHLLKNSFGKYIITLNGVVLAPKNLFSLIDELKEKENRGEKYIISSACDDNGVSWEIPEWAKQECGLEYRPQILRWPCFSRNTLDNYLDGVIFSSRFKHHYVDNWLGTFCALNGSIINENSSVRIKTIPHKPLTENDLYDKEVYSFLCLNYKKYKKYDI